MSELPDFTKEEVNVDELGFSEPSTDNNENDQSVETKTEEVVPEPLVQEVKEETVKTETQTEPVTKEEKPGDVKVSNPPTQYEGESDIQFNYRTQIWQAGQAKAMAETPEEQSLLGNHIKTLRKELGKINSAEKNTPAPVETTQSQTTEPVVDELAQAKKVLNQMGYISKEELPQYIQEIVQGQSRQSEQQEAIRDFYGVRKDIASNPAQREVLERLVVEKFNITPQSSKQDLSLAMDMAASYLFPKENKTAAARQAADKRELTSFSSNTKSEGTPSGVDEKTRADLKAAGWSDEDIDREFK